MTDKTTLAVSSPLDNIEICEQVLSTPRKRDQFIKSLFVASAGLAAATIVPGAVFASANKSLPSSDLDILQFALTLEFLERDFYEKAVAQVPFKSAAVRRLAVTLRDDEAKHTAALSGIISQNGAAPVGRSRYNFGANTFKSEQNFLTLSYMLEDTGVHAYLGQAGNIVTPTVLYDAAAILTVEARHAGAIRYQLGMSPTITPFDEGYTKDKILSIATPLIVS